MARERRPRDDDEDEDDRPVRKRRPSVDDEGEDEPRPMKKARARATDEDDDEEPPRPRKRRDDDDEDEDDDRPRKKFKRKKSGSKGLLIGMIVGGVLLVGVVVLLIVLLGGGSSPKDVMARVIRASKAGDFGTVYDNMASSAQRVIPRDTFIEFGKAAVNSAGNQKRANMTVLGETITGNTARVRVREASGWEDEIPFVKENGKWKLGQ